MKGGERNRQKETGEEAGREQETKKEEQGNGGDRRK